jgi:ABC-2 type transport system permease protein
VIARVTARKAVRSGVIWGSIFGLATASSALSYSTLYKTQAQRETLATAYGTNKATAALFGPAPRLQTVAGFTVFKIGMTLMVVGAVWGLLTSTRLLRGEEDEGRWDLLLAGPTTRRAGTGQALIGLAAGFSALWASTAIITVAIGRTARISIAPGPALYFALAMVATAGMFLGIGVLTSQLAPTRRQAAAYAAVFLGATYGIRLIADAGVGLHGLIWLSPLGWVEELRPLTDPQPLALLPIIGLTGITALAAVSLAGRRDVGAGIISDRTVSGSRSRLLTGPTGLSIRLTRSTVIGWWVAIAISGLLYGLIAKSAGATISGSSVRTVFSRLGATGNGAEAVLGVCFLVIGVLVAFVGAGQLTAARYEEAAGRLDHLLAGTVCRTGWLGGRLLVALAVLVVSGLGAGFFAWLGAASQGSGVELTTLLGAGLNVVPPAIVILGIGVLAFGLVPRATSVVVYSYLGWSLLVVVVGGIGAVDHWILDTSVFHQMASAPARPPDWPANGAMGLVGAVSLVLGVVAFMHRDVQGA